MSSLLRRICLGCIVLVCAVFPAPAQDSSRNGTLLSVLKGDKLLSLAPWLVPDGELLCVVTEKIGTIGQGIKAFVHVLSVYRQQGSNLVKLFDTEKIDGIVNVSPLAQFNGDLLVGWVRDGAYHLEVYTYSNGKVERALDTSSGAMPEIVYGGDGRPAILITHEILVEGRGWIRAPDSLVDVYRRTGKTYDKIAEVPWGKRFQDLPVTTSASSN
jgi:hypothetical protein